MSKMGIFNIFPRFFHAQSKLVRTLVKMKDSGNTHRHGSYIYVFGSGYSFNPKVVYVTIDSKRFLFNCGPGTSRLLNEHRGKFRKLAAIFATRSAWENYGGLPSVALKLNDSRSNDVAVYGVPDIQNLLQASQSFLHMHHSKLIPAYGDYSNKHISISEVKLKREDLNILCGFDKTKQDEETVTAYILKSSKQNCRVVNIDKMLTKGVIPGIQLVELLKGNSVTLPSGEVVHPDDVSSIRQSDYLVVVECPTEEYLTSLEENEKLKQSCIDSNACDTTVIHFTPSDIIKSPRYVKWMKKFSASAYHLVVNESNLADGLMTMRYRQLVLSSLHPGIFPALRDNGYYWRSKKHHQSKSEGHLIHAKSAPYVDSDIKSLDGETPAGETGPSRGSREWLSQWKGIKGLNLYEGRSGTRVPFRPLTLERTSETFFDEYVYHHGYLQTLPQDIAAKIRQKFLAKGVDLTKPLKVQTEYENSYPRVVFLGTSSKTDSRERNVTGILLRISKYSSVVLDCGEDTHSQIHRLYGDRAPAVFRTIDAIYVSHVHGDHHLGVTDVIRARVKAFDMQKKKPKPLIVFATSSLESWFQYTRKYLLRNEQIMFIPLNNLLHNAPAGSPSETMKLMDFVYAQTGLVKVETARVPHCVDSFGVAMRHVDGWKITYSGDTLFSDRLTVIGEGSDLLIHEATYSDAHRDIAVRNRHSTISDALEAARRMNAKFTILTHFSQRYCMLPSDERSDRTDYTFAFDFMQVPLKYCDHLPLLHDLYSYLNDLSKEDEFPVDLFQDERDRLLNI